MLILVTYDVNTQTNTGQKRLRKVAKICTRYGIRVQDSVFECEVDASQYKLLRRDILDVIDDEEDSIRFYNLGNRYRGRIEHYGVKESYDQEGDLIF